MGAGVKLDGDGNEICYQFLSPCRSLVPVLEPKSLMTTLEPPECMPIGMRKFVTNYSKTCIFACHLCYDRGNFVKIAG